MIITMIGTGNAFAKKFYNTNACIEQNGFRLLVDCGITLPYALHQCGISFNQLDAVLISHIHGDHVGGLEEYAFQMKYKYGGIKPTLYIEQSLVSPLWESSLRGGMGYSESDHLSSYFEVKPLKANTPFIIHEGLKVELIQTKHIPGKNSFSFIFNDTFFYSADMIFDRELLLDLEARGVHTFYHDCQLEAPGVVHASLQELLTLPESLQRKIKLMHYGDTIGDYIGKTGFMQIVEQGKPSTIK